MKIIIAAAIYPPEIGGPSFYAAALFEALKGQGHNVEVVTYEKLKSFPSGIRHTLYAIKLLPKSIGANAIISFDTLSGGLPAALVHLFIRVPLVVRIGGDFVWEHYVERTHDLIPLPGFYKHKDRWNLKERLIFSTSRFVLRHSRVVFSSKWQKEIWEDPYHLNKTNITIIENAIRPKQNSSPPAHKNFMLFSRQITLKNIQAFKKAFERAKKDHPDIELEVEMLPQPELFGRLRLGYAVAIPSISEVSPNVVIDAIRWGRPFLLTKYSGYAERFGHYGVLVDPLDENDMVRGILELADPARYLDLQARISQFNEIHSYDDIAREFVAVIEEISAPSR